MEPDRILRLVELGLEGGLALIGIDLLNVEGLEAFESSVVAEEFGKFLLFSIILHVPEELVVVEGHLVEDCRIFTDIRVKAGRTRQQRSGRKISQEELDYLR